MSSIKEIAKGQSAARAKKDGLYKIIAALIVFLLVLLAMIIPQSVTTTGILGYLYQAYTLLFSLIRGLAYVIYELISHVW